MTGIPPVSDARLLRHLQNQEREAAAYRAGGGSVNIDLCAAPHWNRQAWEQYKGVYGHYPFDQSRRPPSMMGAPDWVYELMGMRKPPIEVLGHSVD